MNTLYNIIKYITIVCISTVYLYFGRFITIVIGMFLSAFHSDVFDICLYYVTYIEQLFIMAIFFELMFKERNVTKWIITAICGGLILSIIIIYDYANVESIVIIDQIRTYFYTRGVALDYIVLQILSLLIYMILPSLNFKNIRNR